VESVTAITGYSELVLEALSQDSAMRADVEAIARAAESSASPNSRAGIIPKPKIATSPDWPNESCHRKTTTHAAISVQATIAGPSRGLSSDSGNIDA